MIYNLTLTLPELLRLIEAVSYIKAEFDYRDDKKTKERKILLKRLEKFLD